MLYETKVDSILLKKEIAYIEKYIELQKIRTSNESYIQFEATGITDHHTISPMIFIPFIENAFKHTTNKKVGNAINVQISVNPNAVTFICENKFDPNRKVKDENNGLGNDLIQKRLELIYPNRHKLDVIKKADIYSVHLTIAHE
jgi:LytS/YehU family sensor histidine kinase